jgi:hypothetical protein
LWLLGSNQMALLFFISKTQAVGAPGSSSSPSLFSFPTANKIEQGMKKSSGWLC